MKDNSKDTAINSAQSKENDTATEQEPTVASTTGTEQFDNLLRNEAAFAVDLQTRPPALYENQSLYVEDQSVVSEITMSHEGANIFSGSLYHKPTELAAYSDDHSDDDVANLFNNRPSGSTGTGAGKVASSRGKQQHHEVQPKTRPLPPLKEDKSLEDLEEVVSSRLRPLTVKKNAEAFPTKQEEQPEEPKSTEGIDLKTLDDSLLVQDEKAGYRQPDTLFRRMEQVTKSQACKEQDKLSRDEKQRDASSSSPTVGIPVAHLQRSLQQVGNAPGAFPSRNAGEGDLSNSGSIHYSNGSHVRTDPEMALTPHANEHGLSVANPVTENSEHDLDLPRATPDDNPGTLLEDSKTAAKALHRKIMLITAAVLAIVLVVVVSTVMAVVGDNQEDSRPQSPEQLYTSSPAPTAAPTQGLVLDLPQSTIEALADPDSPQFKAYEWLLADPFLNEYTEQRKRARFALATYYHATGGPTAWRANNDWLSYNVSECDWYSSLQIYNQSPCDEDGNYKDLASAANGLQGTIPPEIGLLSPSLKQFSLGMEGGITGSLPTEMGLLTKLDMSILVRTPLVGQIPSELGLATDMYLFIVQGTALSGSLPSEIGMWTSTKVPRKKFSFAGNKGVTVLPTEIGLVRGLQFLLLDGTGSMGVQQSTLLPSEIGLLSSLQGLEVTDSGYEGTIPTEFGNLESLQSLVIRGNDVIGTIPSELSTLSNLKSLDMADNQLTGPVPAELDQLLGLELLDMHGNALTGSFPQSILSDLVNLTTLNLTNTQLTGTVPDSSCQQIANLSIVCPSVCGCDCPCPDG